MKIYLILILSLISGLHGQQVWRSMEGPPVSFNDIAYGNGVLVGITKGGLTYASSDGGETWSMRSVGGARFRSANRYFDIDGIVFDGARFCVAYDGFSAVSPDGLEWTIMKNDLVNVGGDLVYGKSGVYLCAQSLAGNPPRTVIYYSNDLISWRSVTSMDGFFKGVATDGVNLFISAFSAGEFYLKGSVDGINWEAVEPNLYGGIELLGYAEGHFYGKRWYDLGYIRSTDGVNWSSIAFPSEAGVPTGEFMSLGGAVVMATNNGFIRSTDGQLFDFHPVPAIETWGVASSIAGWPYTRIA